ncbi:MAG: TNT domain-containing protein [Lachnospiraceae bacterium]|nr:TNT domain-containing protein [Lachnospiraceae bacterium]
MASITIDCIDIDGITEKYLLLDLKLNIEPNDHGHAELLIRMVDEGRGENLLKSMENKMITIKSKAKDNTGILFKGYMESCMVRPQIDGETVEIGLVTATVKADDKLKSCSFQKEKMKYSEIIDMTAAECKGVCRYYDSGIKSKTILKPVIRYKETGWEFIKRMASRHWMQVIPDETADKPVFTVGLKQEGSAPERGFFQKEYIDFMDVGAYIERKLKEEDCSASAEDYKGIKARSFNNYKIGMSSSFRRKNMVICAKRAEMEGAQIVFTYVLGSKELYAPEPKYNMNLHGRCLEGKVVKCENETVKMQLDIDVKSESEKPESELYRFNWQPETGNLMYCMPEKDTVVSLYVGGVDEGEAIVINSLRKDKGRDIDDPEKRYLTSLDKKRMFIKKKEIGFSMEDKDEGKTYFSLNDDKGGIFSTDKSITIQADGKIRMIGKTVNAEAEKELEALNGTTNVQIKERINIKGTMSFLGYGATAPERQEKADKMNTSKLRLPDKYESELERMSQEIMEGYFRKDGGKLSPEDRASMAKTLIMVHEMTDVQKRKNNLPPESADVMDSKQQVSYYKGNGKYNIKYAWEDDDTVPDTREMTILKKGEQFDRVGPETGRCVGKVGSDGSCAKIEERSIPYYFSGDDVEKEPSYHRYEARQDFTRENLERAIDETEFYTDLQKEQMKESLSKYYDYSHKKYGEGDGLTTGKIAPMFGKSGGGMQHDMPFSMDVLQDLGMISAV